jgi:hypothetical protein
MCLTTKSFNRHQPYGWCLIFLMLIACNKPKQVVAERQPIFTESILSQRCQYISCPAIGSDWGNESNIKLIFQPYHRGFLAYADIKKKFLVLDSTLRVIDSIPYILAGVAAFAIENDVVVAFLKSDYVVRLDLKTGKQSLIDSAKLIKNDLGGSYSTFSPPYLFNNTLYLQPYPGYDFSTPANTLKYYKSPPLMSYNISTNKTSFLGFKPDTIWKKINFVNQIPIRAYRKGTVVESYFAYPHLVTYNVDGDKKEQIDQPVFNKNLSFGVITTENVDSLLVTNNCYPNLLYDHYRDVYYRVFKYATLNQPADKIDSDEEDWDLQVLNPKLEIIKIIHMVPGYGSFYDLLVFPQGLGIQTNTQNKPDYDPTILKFMVFNPLAQPAPYEAKAAK